MPRRRARRGTAAPSASVSCAPWPWASTRPLREQGMRPLRPGPDDVEHSPKSCVVENPVGLRSPSATNRRARARQGDGGEEKAEDVASTMSHGATVGPHPRRTGWGLFPVDRAPPAQSHHAWSRGGGARPFSPYASPRESVAHQSDLGRPVLRHADATRQGHSLRAPGAPVPPHGPALRRALRRGMDVERMAGAGCTPGPRHRPGGPRARDRRAVRRPVQVL